MRGGDIVRWDIGTWGFCPGGKLSRGNIVIEAVLSYLHKHPF